jgi:hypothetical protein
MARAGTVDLEVAYSALGVDGSETSNKIKIKRCVRSVGRAERAYGKLPAQESYQPQGSLPPLRGKDWGEAVSQVGLD